MTNRQSTSFSSNRACRRFNKGFINSCNNKNHLMTGGRGGERGRGRGGGRGQGRGWRRLRRVRFDDEDEKTDRLSVLPDDIIHHIFSYLDAPVVVQTSFLSRRWRQLWTTCPHLKIQCSSAFFVRRPLFLDKFVTNVLSYRNHDSLLQKVQASMFCIGSSDSVRASVIDYAISHGVTHLSLCFVYGTPIPQQLSACKSLKTLSLRGFFIPEQPFCSLLLTTLHLSNSLTVDLKETVNALIPSMLVPI
uniref:Putative F-box/FBD/LRR-repeat protein At4g03220 isoform X1 n=1 Tax=Rhizophora mucronata TaxID=61149 RepID=A0A2P2IUF9_RHIMU